LKFRTDKSPAERKGFYPCIKKIFEVSVRIKAQRNVKGFFYPCIAYKTIKESVREQNEARSTIKYIFINRNNSKFGYLFIQNEYTTLRFTSKINLSRKICLQKLEKRYNVTVNYATAN
jgi:hypothetical protein